MLNTSNGSTEPTRFQQDLRVYPPILRKLAVFISNSTELMSFPEYRRASGLSYSSIRDAVIKARRKGNEYNDFLANLYSKKLALQRPVAFKKLMDGVQKGSAKHLEIFFKLTGDLHQEPKNEANTTINNLCFVLPMPSSIPQPAIPEHNGAEGHSAIDVDVPLVRDTEEVHQCPFCGCSFETLEMLGEHLTGEHERG